MSPIPGTQHHHKKVHILTLSESLILCHKSLYTVPKIPTRSKCRQLEINAISLPFLQSFQQGGTFKRAIQNLTWSFFVIPALANLVWAINPVAALILGVYILRGKRLWCLIVAAREASIDDKPVTKRALHCFYNAGIVIVSIVDTSNAMFLVLQLLNSQVITYFDQNLAWPNLGLPLCPI